MSDQNNPGADGCQSEPPAATQSKKILAFPALALLSGVSTIACCLPLGFLGALAAAGGGAFFATVRPWLMGISFLFLVVGFFQLYRKPVCRTRGRTAVVAMFWITTVLVLLLLAFPQIFANLAAGLGE
jgi:hypothetical protein